MNYLDIIKKESLKLPSENGSGSFIEHLDRSYDQFLSDIQQIDEGTIIPKIEDTLPGIEALCEAIIESYKLYTLGRVSQAYKLFSTELDRLENVLIYDRVAGRTSIQPNTPLFRARVGDSRQYTIEEIFHVPFEKRNYTNTARYSIPSIPCLYLSNSTYLCWQELGRPEFSSLQFSRLKSTNTKSIVILDLCHTTNHITSIIEATIKAIGGKEKIQDWEGWDDWIISYFIKWPLLLATSTKVKDRIAPHKPEYVFPQFLIEWISSREEIHGIKYFSIEASQKSQLEYGCFYNYAIPIQTVASNGYCQYLKEQFELTYPISWNSLFTANPNVLHKTEDDISKYLYSISSGEKISTIELNKGIVSNYWKSLFGILEMEISKLQFHKIE